MKPCTDLYVFIFGGREFQTDDPENAKLILYRSVRVRGKTFKKTNSYRAGAERDRQTDRQRQTERDRQAETDRDTERACYRKYVYNL